MIRLNRETDYSFRVIVALSEEKNGSRLSTSRIQSEMHIPPSFLHRIIALLARNNLIRTFPGREGGVELARPPQEISLLDVYEAVEGPIQLSPCFSGETDCPMDTPCPVQKCLRRIQQSFMRELDSVNFEQIKLDACEYLT